MNFSQSKDERLLAFYENVGGKSNSIHATQGLGDGAM
jgi:hypothetical protein